MSIGDQSGNGTNFSGSNAKTWANFDNVPGGIVNALVDRLYIAVDKSTNSTDYNTQAGLIIGAGLFDVNTAIVGYQRNSGATNRNYSDGQVIVRSNAVLKINKSIELGYTTEDPNNTVAQPYNNRGRLSIGPGGTAMVNTVLVGGLTKAGNANAVSLTSGAALIVSNKIASPDQWLTTLGVSGESTLTLHLNGTNTGYYVYATNLNVSAGCTLNIASAANVVVPAEGTNVPTFLFVNGGAGNFSVTMPSPMRGTIVPGDSPGESDLLIITNEPRNLVWRRLVNNNWDSTTSNWINTATLQPARFITGDNVLFDDATLPSTTINVAATIVPGAITVSNENNSFVLADGGGSIPGGSLTKEGSGSLAIDASTSIPVEVNGGKLVGLGTVGSVTVASGAELDFSGTISPSGLSCYGTATLRGSTIGTITVQTGGVVTNAETGTSQGSISTRSGSLLYNVGHLGNGGVGIGSSTIVSNATFINAGNIGLSGVNSTLTINGVFKEMGVVGKDVYLTLLDINGGTGTNNNNAGTFIPGGDGIGVTTIKSPGIAGVSFSGRVRLGVGSTNIFKVNPATTNTVLQAAWIDYGPSIGNPGFEGGFIWVTNVGVTPFAAGQRFGLFKYEDGTLPIQFGSTNSYPLMIPTVPGPGLAWDLNDVKMNGNVGIRSYSTTPTNIAFASFYTLVTNLTSTNRGIVMSLQWPSNHIGGWHVEEQTSTRAAGIQMGASNWAPIFASYFTNQIFVTNLINGNGANFYRLTSP
jgi:hypothetical protein